MKKILASLLVLFTSLSVSPALALMVQAPQPTFSDVSANYPYSGSISALAQARVITGYSDGTFRPRNTVNRAELLILAYRAQNITIPANTSGNCFPDVSTSEWYGDVVCDAKQAGVIAGYPDGLFHPERTVTLAEAAKIIDGIAKFNVPALQSGEAWYMPYLAILVSGKYIPTSFSWVGQGMSRGELAEIFWRIRTNTHDRTGVSLSDLSAAACLQSGDEIDSRFDTALIRTTWLSWVNDARQQGELQPYTENQQLDRTAMTWSKTMRDKGEMTHMRDPGDAYYDSVKINAWFANQGIVAKDVSGFTQAETIGSSSLICSETECTTELLKSLKLIFNLYMAEESQEYGTFARSHYESVMGQNYTQIGFGFVLSGNKIYAATHYVTEITSNPDPICKMSS